MSGDSESGESDGWKIFDLQYVSDLQMLSTRFERVQPDYNEHDSFMIRVLAAVRRTQRG
jgi:hypothetical protein